MTYAFIQKLVVVIISIMSWVHDKNFILVLEFKSSIYVCSTAIIYVFEMSVNS